MLPDRQTIIEQLRAFICSVILQKPDYPLRDDESLINSRLLDSFSLVDIAVFVDEQLGVFIPTEDVDADQMDTLAQMADFIIAYRAAHPAA